MSKETITEWVKAGYPYLKEGAGLPSWALPASSLELVVDELKDSGILGLSRPLKLAGNIEAVHDRMPDPSVFSAEAWQQAVSQWPPLAQVMTVVEAYLEVADRVAAQLGRIGDRIEPAVIRRSLAVLLLAPLVPQGKRLTVEMAGVLAASADQPEQLLRGYAGAVMEGDVATVEAVNQCIVKYSTWAKWAKELQRQTEVMKCRPRLVAVTPPLSSELASVLAVMIKEEEQDGPGRDYSEHPAR